MAIKLKNELSEKCSTIYAAFDDEIKRAQEERDKKYSFFLYILNQYIIYTNLV